MFEFTQIPCTIYPFCAFNFHLFYIRSTLGIDSDSLIYFTQQKYKTFFGKCSGGVMVSVLASSALDRGFKYRSGQAKDC
jgi:hypothetical protein